MDTHHHTDVGTAPESLSLVLGFSGQTVLWVDDRALLSKAQTEVILASSQEAKATELWPMDARWVESVLKSETDFVPEDTAFQKSAIELCRICRARRFNLSLTTFKHAHRIAELDAPTLFLLDLQNTTQALGYTTLRRGKTDQDWNWEIYGAEFARYYDVPKTRFRFLTRYRDIKRYTDQVVEECERLFNRDVRYLDHCVPLSGDKHLVQCFEEFLQINSFTADPVLNEAIVFAMSPPGEDQCWIHNRLHPESKPDGEPTHNRLLAKWLDMQSVDANSAKALLLSGFGWQVQPTDEQPYMVACPVIEALSKRIRTPIEIELSAGSSLGLPSSPGMPFFIALRALFFEMEIDDEYHAPKQAILSKMGLTYTLTIVLNPFRKDDPTKPISIEEFEKAFKRAQTSGENGKHLVTGRLVDLTHARVTLGPESPTTRVGRDVFFEGAKENGAPISVAWVEFDDGEQKAIHVRWPCVS